MAHRGFLRWIIAFLAVITGPVFAARAGLDVPQPEGLRAAGVYDLKHEQPSLDGTGLKIAVVCRSVTYLEGQPQNDFLPDIKHNCLAGSHLNLVSWPQLPREVSPHSTAVCSILFGKDPNGMHSQLGPFSYEGVVPGASADIYEFWNFITDKVFSSAAPAADVVTIDAGSQFEDWWTRGIDAMAEHYGTVVVAGIGNGLASYDPPLYPGASDNVIGVGVIDCVNVPDTKLALSRFSLANPDHSTFGPTIDGKSKPDIVAPGNCLAAAGSEPNRYEPTGNWSSFSTPIVAGIAGLLIQKAKADPALHDAINPQGGNSVIKAVLLNSAVKLPYWHKGKLTKDDDHLVPLDYLQGAGLVNAVRAYNQLVAGKNSPPDVRTRGWDSSELSVKNSENTYRFNITRPADVNFITATLCWNRHYRNEYPFDKLTAKDADLRLELWAIDGKDPNKDYLLDYSDSPVDNIEHIFVRPDPNYTIYNLIVSYGEKTNFNQPLIEQRYAVAWDASPADKNTPHPEKAFDISWYDLNGDGVVNEADFTILMNNIVKSRLSPNDYIVGDLNANGTVDVNDLKILIRHKGQTANWLAR